MVADLNHTQFTPKLMKAMERFEFGENDRCVLCPLNQVKTGVAVRIKQLCASPEISHRLREIGFCEDQIIRLLTSQANIICQVCNARLAISAQQAQEIMVEPVLQQVGR